MNNTSISKMKAVFDVIEKQEEGKRGTDIRHPKWPISGF